MEGHDHQRGNGSDTGQQGFQFPGQFEITAVGRADADLRERVPQLLQEVGLEVAHESLRHRHSREGNYVSVTVRFQCPSRVKYEQAHTVLRNDDAIKYTL